MTVHINYSDPRHAATAAEILRRHERSEPKANITSAARDFLTSTGLVKHDEIVEENPPTHGSRQAVAHTGNH